MPNTLPYVSAALLCEKVLQEVNGSLSIIRIADQIIIDTNLPAGLKPIISISGLVALKSGNVKGLFTLAIDITNPKQESKRVNSWPFELHGNDHGANLILQMNLGIDTEGLYWFDVLVDEKILSRIPLMVVKKQIEAEVT